jgi:hypothetical protein
MKKSIFTLLMLAMFATSFISCNKDDDKDGGGDSLEQNSWSVEGSVFKTNSLLPPEFSGNRFNAIGQKDEVNSVLIVTFSAKPTAAKNYTVVSATVEDAALTADQCKLSVTNTGGPSARIYGSTGKTGDRVAVTIEGGKVVAKVNGAEMFYFESSVEKRTTLSAFIKEK